MGVQIGSRLQNDNDVAGTCRRTTDPAAVPQFQVRELAVPGVGGERGEPVPVEVGEPQLRPRVRAYPR
jgi:hypothetical protein